MVFVKLAVLVFFIVVGLTVFDADNLRPFAPNGLDGITAAAAIIFFAFIGFDAVSTGSEGPRSPAATCPSPSAARCCSPPSCTCWCR